MVRTHLHMYTTHTHEHVRIVITFDESDNVHMLRNIYYTYINICTHIHAKRTTYISGQNVRASSHAIMPGACCRTGLATFFSRIACSRSWPTCTLTHTQGNLFCGGPSELFISEYATRWSTTVFARAVRIRISKAGSVSVLRWTDLC